MIIVKTSEGFVKEEYPYSVSCGFYITNNVAEATQYKSPIEFLCALKYVNNRSGLIIPIESVMLIDTSTLNEIDVNLGDLGSSRFLKRNLEVDSKTFQLLKKCFYTSSHWLYSPDITRIPFPKGDEDIGSIRYYKRGLVSIIRDVFHYRNASIPSCYKFYKNRMPLINDTIMQIALDESIDDCEEFVVKLDKGTSK